MKINNIEIYSIYNGGKPVVAERCITTLKKIKQTMFIFYVLDDFVNKYNNTVHTTIRMLYKPGDVTSDSYAEYNEGSNVTKPKFKVGIHVRFSIYKNIFAKEYTQNWSEEDFVIVKLKTQFLGFILLVI